jgi:hypothetical protein
VTALVNGRRIAVGNEKLMGMEGAASHPCELKGTVIHVSIDGVYAGHIVISDRVKADAADTIAALHRAGIRQTVMLTGDQPEIAEAVASEDGHQTNFIAKKAKIVGDVAPYAAGRRPDGPGIGISGDERPCRRRGDVHVGSTDYADFHTSANITKTFQLRL